MLGDAVLNADFPRLITLLRKECGYSQKQAAQKLGISQALLSHYEKGIRECGLNFIVAAAELYGVSCDYLLGRSPDRNGSTLAVEDIPEPEAAGRDMRFSKSIFPVLNKKLIANSLNILFDLLGKCESKTLVKEVSTYLMAAVYRMFRVVFSANSKNHNVMFSVPPALSEGYCDALMNISAQRAAAAAKGELPGADEITNPDELLITTESLSSKYPLFATSLFNLIQNTENNINSLTK